MLLFQHLAHCCVCKALVSAEKYKILQGPLLGSDYLFFKLHYAVMPHRLIDDFPFSEFSLSLTVVIKLVIDFMKRYDKLLLYCF